MATMNQVGVGLSGATGTGAFVGSNTPTLTTPIIGAASATSIAFTSTSEIIGTTTNNDAAAGSVGQLVSVVALSGSGDVVSLSSTVTADLFSISLTAGDWDVWGNVGFAPSVGVSRGIANITTTSATISNAALRTDLSLFGTTVADAFTLPVAQLRFSLSGTTTIYMAVQATVATGSCNAYGGMYARRAR